MRHLSVHSVYAIESGGGGVGDWVVVEGRLETCYFNVKLYANKYKIKITNHALLDFYRSRRVLVLVLCVFVCVWNAGAPLSWARNLFTQHESNCKGWLYLGFNGMKKHEEEYEVHRPEREELVQNYFLHKFKDFWQPYCF